MYTHHFHSFLMSEDEEKEIIATELAASLKANNKIIKDTEEDTSLHRAEAW